MKIISFLVCMLFSIFQLSFALAWTHGGAGAAAPVGAVTQTGGPGISALVMNSLKAGQAWVCNTGGAHAQPSDVDVNGYPISTAPCMATGGFNVPNISTPSQFERAGNYVITAAGQGTSQGFNNNGSSTGAACVGTQSGGGNQACNNAACTAATGSITGTTLTITVASSCSMVVYQPITSSNTFTNQFGVPTAIIGNSTTNSNLCSPACTGAGGTGTYAVNFSQTVASGSLTLGMYNELTSGIEKVVGSSAWQVRINATAVSPNNLRAMAFVHKNDLLAYYQGTVTSVIARQRFTQGAFAYLRDLSSTNQGNATTWSTNKPTAYYTWASQEMRASLFACSYGLYNGTTPCQTTYALSGSNNNYSVNLGGSPPVDKQTVCVQYSTTTTNTNNFFSVDNGNTFQPIVAYHGGNMGTGNIIANHMDGLVYDATIGKWFSNTQSGTSDACLNTGYPPAAFLQINQELGTTPWIIEPYLAADPITDWALQYAKLLQPLNFNSQPVIAIPDEPWNCGGQGIGPYVTLKSAVYTAADTGWSSNASGLNCGTGGDNYNWAGKAASLLGQVIRPVSNTYILLVGVQTTFAGGGTPQARGAVTSVSYVAQNPANIPIQTGCAGAAAIQTGCPAPFTQTAAYNAMKGATSRAAGVEIVNYWSLIAQQGTAANNATQIQLAFCYYFQAAGCASQSSLMTSYFSQTTFNTTGSDNPLSTIFPNWYTFANTCGAGAGCTPMSVYTYEGAYDIWGSVISTDYTGQITAATNVAQAVLSVANNGCVVNQPVALGGLAGGTWNTAGGNYTVQAATGSTCTVNLNSTGLGTLTPATATSSASWVINASTVSVTACPTMSTGSFVVIDNTTGFNNGVASGCSAGTLTFPNKTLHSGGNGDSLTFQPTLTYTGSANYVTYLQTQSYIAPQLGTNTTTFLNGIASSGASSYCNPNQCSYAPAQLGLTGFWPGVSEWFLFSPDLYGYFGVASCTSCSITGGNLTLGGTITGIWKSGQTIVGGAIDGATLTAGCSQTGSLPAGANSGDVCPISNATTASGLTLSGTIPPGAPGSGLTSAVPAWAATCTFNGNGAAC